MMNLRARKTVFVDARCLQQKNYRSRGIGRHVRSLLAAMPAELRTTARIVGLTDYTEQDLMPADAALFDEVSNQFVCEPDSIFINAAPLNNGEMWRAPADSNITRIGIVYDFIAHDFPGLVNADSAVRTLLRNTRELRRYDLLAPISLATEQRQKSLVSGDAPSIVTGVIVKDVFFERGAERNDSSFSFPHPFFLVAAGDNPRKNVETAIKAFGRAGPDLARVHLLVLGGYDREAQARVRQAVGAADGVDWSRVHFLRRIDDAVLADAYRAAIATIVPSFIEGFSLPVVESIASGGLAIASSCEAHRELIDHPLCAPDDIDEFKRLMVRSFTDSAWREEAIGRQKGAAERFRSTAVGQHFWSEIFAFRPARVSGAQVAAASRNSQARPKILFVTPYPPEPTGVGQLHAEVMPAFLRRADVTVATLKAARREEATARHPRIIRPNEIVFEDYDRIFYVLGNSLYHTFVHDLLLERGGEAIYHDSRLFEYYLNTRGHGRTAAMIGHLIRRPVSQEEINAWIKDRRKLPVPLMDEVVRASTRIFVFTPVQRDAIRRFYGRDSVLQPIPLHSAFDDSLLAPGRVAEARSRLGFSTDTLNICSFGTVDTSKGCYESILAIEQLRAYGRNAKLHFVGGCDPALRAHLEDLLIEPRNLQAQVVFHGSTPPDMYMNFLVAADLGMQFRRAPFGQPSGGLTECIAAGLWTVSNDILAEAHQAPHYVARVSDSLSPLSIALAVLDLLDSTDIKVRDRKARNEALQGRSRDDYAASLLDV